MKALLKTSCNQKCTDSWWYVIITENVFFNVMTGTRSVFVFVTHGGPVYTNPSFTKLSQS